MVCRVSDFLPAIRGNDGRARVTVDHSTPNRWVIKYAPEIEEQFWRRRPPVGKSWRVDGTYIRVKGEWKYRHRAVL